MIDLSFTDSWLREPRLRSVCQLLDPAPDESYLRLALFLAREARERSNPPGGAVVASHGKIIAVGRNERGGAEHAEMIALAEAGLLARGATLYTTFEPCLHHPARRSCVDSILRAGIARVVFASEDPSSSARAGGARKLERHGISVRAGVLRERAERLILDHPKRDLCA